MYSKSLEPGGVIAPEGGGRASGSLRVLSPPALFEAARRARGDVRLVMRHPGRGAVVVVVFHRGEPTMVFSPGDGRSLGELLLAAGALDRAALDALLQERPQAPACLERLIADRTTLTREEIQAVFDFQARLRLLDSLLWHDGFFELQEYVGGGESAFRLALPALGSLLLRAQARADALPRLLGRLPAPPSQTLIRRRRGGRPQGPLEERIWNATAEPLLLTQIVARLLVDDDLVIDAALGMVADKSLVMQPLAVLAPLDPAAVASDPRLDALVPQILGRLRGEHAARGQCSLWVYVLSACGDGAARLVSRIGPGTGVMLTADGDSGLAARSVPIGHHSQLCLLGLRPDALSRGALEGLMGRCDVLLLARFSGDVDEQARLESLRQLASPPSSQWRPLVLGLDLGAGFRPWSEYPDALLGLTQWAERPSGWLVERLLEGIVAASSARCDSVT